MAERDKLNAADVAIITVAGIWFFFAVTWPFWIGLIALHFVLKYW